MLSIRIVAMVVALLLPTSLLAQGWTEYVDRTERFSINFQAGRPSVRRPIRRSEERRLGHVSSRCRSAQPGTPWRS
jgi:HAMP domain-containing protein